MRNPVFFNYGRNDAGVLIVSCYHAKDISSVNYKSKAVKYRRITPDAPFSESQKKEITVAQSVELEIARENLKTTIMRELENILEQSGGAQNVAKLIFLADVNLCIDNDIAEFLVDNTLPNTFAGKGIVVERILESGTPEVVQKGINLYDSLPSESKDKFLLTIKVKGKAADPISSVNTVLEQKILAKRDAFLNPPHPDPGDEDISAESNFNDNTTDGDSSNQDTNDMASVSEPTKSQGQLIDSISDVSDETMNNISSQLNRLEVATQPISANNKPKAMT
ncbi:hypothetical protein ACNVED_11830 [Legionella sp. D16C41]|uniref:hypothetical protein n=1 Tax=Legionella sp. D16C41 TaxID=3402688 RepID=UPI003AF5B7C9